MSSSIKIVVIAVSLLALVGSAAGSECYECSLNPPGQSCETPTNETLIDRNCPENDSCISYAQIITSVSSLHVFERGCNSSSAITTKLPNCCQSFGTDANTVECGTACDGDLCNSEPINTSSVVETLPKCLYAGDDTYMICNLCLSTGTNCVSHPDTAHVNQMLCPHATHYCTIQHTVYTLDPSTIYTFERNCHLQGSQAYGRTDGDQYLTWICHCSSDYCNDNTLMGTTEECHPPTEGPGVNHAADVRRYNRDVFSQLSVLGVIIISSALTSDFSWTRSWL